MNSGHAGLRMEWNPNQPKDMPLIGFSSLSI
jgi:hypothetical protein